MKKIRAAYCPKISIIITLGACFLYACTPVSRNLPAYWLDAGTMESPLSPGYDLLSSADNPENGWTWETKPDSAVWHTDYRPGLPLLEDGLLFKEQAVLKIKTQPGTYFLTATVGQAGDTAIVEIETNQTKWHAELPWRRIRHQSFREKIEITGDSLVITFRTQLGQGLIKAVELQPVMDYFPLPSGLETDTAIVGKLADELENKLKHDPQNTALRAQWIQSLKYLQAARYYDIGWWSWAVKATKMSIFPRFDVASDYLRQIVADPNDPLYDRAAYLLGKIHYWLYLEQEFAHDKIEAREFFDLLGDRYPDFELLRMYRGEKITYESPCNNADPTAPRWAVLQRELMCRMLEIIHWWVSEKQAENGELGGKFGDDVEILRWWLPAILGADDSLARVGYTRLAEGVWQSGTLENAYSKKLEDVEHAAELFRDTHSALLMIHYGDPEYVERCLRSMQNFRDVWTGITPRGHRHIKSSHFSATAMREGPPFGVDVPMNTRATLPGLWAAWYSHNPQLVQLFTEWGKAWVEDAARTEKGKPKGLLPAAVSFPGDEIGGYSPEWYFPRQGWDYYNWQHMGGVSEMYHQLIGMYDITGDETFLIPVNETIRLARDTKGKGDSKVEGSAAWAGAYLRGEVADDENHRRDGISMMNIARTITGNNQFDAFLGAYGSPYLQYTLDGNISRIESGLEEAVEALRYNLPLRTTEVKFTDRVYVEGEDLLSGMYTGHPGKGIEYPGMAVTWKNTGREIAVLTEAATPGRLKVQIYNFGPAKTIQMQLWRLKPGLYSLHGLPGTTRIEVTERGQMIPIMIPEGILLNVEIEAEKISKDTFFPSADLAINSRDIVVDGRTIRATVHNIGNQTAENITVVCRVNGKDSGKHLIARLPAPLNMAAQTAVIEFESQEDVGEAQIEIIYSGKEITKLNNRANSLDF
ncbi:MAG: hypothetical protein R3D00_10510 [Bacteroidia bacterium]